jgi:hypothetical protein
MGMYSLKSYRLTKDEYNYLLPVLKDKLLYKGEKFPGIGLILSLLLTACCYIAASKESKLFNPKF